MGKEVAAFTALATQFSAAQRTSETYQVHERQQRLYHILTTLIAEKRAAL